MKKFTEVHQQADAIYQRLMGTRADEITRLKAALLARRLHEKEEGIRQLNMRVRNIRSNFEKFINACMQDSLQRDAGIKHD